jgi:hypothetical protein
MPRPQLQHRVPNATRDSSSTPHHIACHKVFQGSIRKGLRANGLLVICYPNATSLALQRHDLAWSGSAANNSGKIRPDGRAQEKMGWHSQIASDFRIFGSFLWREMHCRLRFHLSHRTSTENNLTRSTIFGIDISALGMLLE